MESSGPKLPPEEGSEIKKDMPAKFAFGFKAKAVVAFFAFNVVVSSALSITAYRVLYSNMFDEIRGRTKDIAQLGTHAIDRTALKHLVVKVSPDLAGPDVGAVEKSLDFRRISDQLNLIRDTEAGLIRYAYILLPSADGRGARYVADADTLSDLAEAGRDGDKLRAISRFNSPVDTSRYPVFYEAVKEGRVAVERQFYYDDVFKVYSISAYAPIMDGNSGALLAVLCLDVIDKNVRDALKESRDASLIIIAISVAFSLIISIFLGNVFSKGVRALDAVVGRYTQRDFSARCPVRSGDEIGRLGFSLNYMAETIQNYAARLENLLAAYSRFVPKKFLHFLQKESIVDVQLGDQVQREMTILFSDIRSFTTLSESMTPAENFNFINSYLRRVGPTIRHHSGFIDKYIGDGIMALFPNEPDDAVMASIDMIKAVEEYNIHRSASGYQPIRIGVGIHTGMLMLGTIGEDERMDGSVISDAVNLCSRLEGLTKVYKVSVIISRETLEKLRDPGRYHIRFLDNVQVKGKTKAVSVYEVYDADPVDVIERKDKSRERTESAIRLFFERRPQDALNILAVQQEEYPDDTLIKMYADRCRKFIGQGLQECP